MTEKFFKDNIDFKPTEACEDLSEFNAVSPEEQIAAWSSGQGYDYQERMDNLRKKYPQLFDGSMSPFGPRTEEEKQARVQKWDKEIENGVFYPIETLFDEMHKEFPWLCE